MKKVLMQLVIFLLLITNVNAKENTLHINENGKKIYYESKLFDKETFMNHVKMMPGEVYTDELVIENNSKKELEIILKIDIGTEKDKLLENINMEITLSDESVFEGTIQIENEEDGEINLGKFAPNDKKILKVSSKLLEDYDPYTDKTSKINWTFYVKEKNKSKVPIIEGSTIRNVLSTIITILLLFVSVVLLILGLRMLFTKEKEKEEVLDENVEVLAEDEDLEILTETNNELEIEIPSINYNTLIEDSRDVIDSKSKLPSENGNLILNIHIEGLKNLKTDDKIYIIYNNTRYTYKLLNVYNITEDGFVEVDNNSKRNTLTIMDINQDGPDYIAIFYLA